MKKIAIVLSFSMFVFSACSNQAQVAQTSNSNANVSVQKSNDSSVISSHSAEKGAASSNSSASSSSSGGSPMAKAIDVTEMTVNIEKAAKIYKAKPSDAKAKDALAETYFVRAFALTDAAQYRAALGDFRKGLKLNPNATEAREMHDKIIDIFQSINREPPKEGEEPPPLPFKKNEM